MADLVWDFSRTVGSGDGVIGTAEFFDEAAQTLFLDNGKLRTEITDVTGGDWSGATWTAAADVQAGTRLDTGMDHPDNYALFFASATDSGLVFERYVYAMDVSSITDAWTWTLQNDNSIQQCSATISNIGRSFFDYDLTLFQPGSRIRLRVRMGNSLPYTIGVAYLDDVQYDEMKETVSISGRNRSGYQLKETQLGEHCTLTGTAQDIFEQLMELAGVDDYHWEVTSEPDQSTHTFELDPKDTVQDALDAICDLYTSETDGRQTLETPSGRIINGYAAFRAAYLPNGYFVFDQRHEVFSRKTTRDADAAYAKIYLTNKDDEEAAPVTRTVSRDDAWQIPPNKTYFQELSGMTAGEISTYAGLLVKWLKNTGVKENITGPFRPQLIVNDIAQTDNGDGTATTIGIVTSVKHFGGKKTGYKTQFTTDSGGEVFDDPSFIYVRSALLGGRTRNMRVVDFILNAIKGKR